MPTALAPRMVIVVASLVLTLSLTTGTVLGRLVFARPADALPSPTAGPEVTLVRQFYAAVNGVLQTGKPGDLDDVLAVDFIEHPERTGTASGKAGLIETVTTLRAMFPTLHVVVEDVRAAGDQVTARVRLIGTDGHFLGLPVNAAQVPWGPIDLFRIAHGAIVEHWGIPEDTGHFQSVTQGAIHIPAEPRRRVAWEQRVYAAGATWAGEIALGPVLIMGRTGYLKVTVDEAAATPAHLVHKAPSGGATPSEPIGAGVIATVVSGDLLVLSQGSRFTTSNWDSTTTTILVLTLEAPVIPGGAPMPAVIPPDGVTTELQATGPAVAIPADAIVRIGRMTLGPGAELPLHANTGPELVIIEDGALTLTSGQELAWLRQGDDPESSGEHLATLRAGDGAFVPPGAIATYRNASTAPITVLLLTILPAV